MIGPFFRSKKIIKNNILIAFSKYDNDFYSQISKRMWESYGKILAEYTFLKKFRNTNTDKFLEVSGQEILDNIKKLNEPTIFISGHFDNFELMAMHIEKSGINLYSIYIPFNNIFINPIMEIIRKMHLSETDKKRIIWH